MAIRALILGDGLMASALNDLTDWPMIGHQTFDIQDHDSIVRVLRQYQPDVVVNTVALHSLAQTERNSTLAFGINARGAERVASLVRTIYISTDYVFSDGGPHDECMPGRQPRSVYGRSKLAGELATLERDGLVVRVSGLYHHRHQSHKGPSFPQAILSGWDPMELPTDQVFSPTYAPDAAARIEALALDPEAKGIYHAANAGSVSWASFAETIAKTARHRRKIKGVEKRDPIRPTNSALRSTRLPALRHWLPALEDFFINRQAWINSNAVSPLRSAS